MSKENYIAGFKKIAQSKGCDPEQLARFALSSKLQKRAFLGAATKVLKGATKAAPLLNRVTKPLGTVGRAVANNITKPREIVSALKKPSTWGAIVGAPAGFFAADRLSKTRAGKYISSLFANPLKPAGTNKATAPGM